MLAQGGSVTNIPPGYKGMDMRVRQDPVYSPWQGGPESGRCHPVPGRGRARGPFKANGGRSRGACSPWNAVKPGRGPEAAVVGQGRAPLPSGVEGTGLRPDHGSKAMDQGTQAPQEVGHRVT